jgi:hypothetical protein
MLYAEVEVQEASMDVDPYNHFCALQVFVEGELDIKFGSVEVQAIASGAINCPSANASVPMYELEIHIPKAKIMDGFPEVRDVELLIEGQQTASPRDDAGDNDDLRWTGSFKGTIAWDVTAGLPSFGDAEVEVTVEADFSYGPDSEAPDVQKFACCDAAHPLVVYGSFRTTDRKNDPTLVITGAFDFVYPAFKVYAVGRMEMINMGGTVNGIIDIAIAFDASDDQDSDLFSFSGVIDRLEVGDVSVQDVMVEFSIGKGEPMTIKGIIAGTMVVEGGYARGSFSYDNNINPDGEFTMAFEMKYENKFLRAKASGSVTSACLVDASAEARVGNAYDTLPASHPAIAASAMGNALAADGTKSFFAGSANVCIPGALMVNNARFKMVKDCNPDNPYKFEVEVGVTKVSISSNLQCNLDLMDDEDDIDVAGDNTYKDACMRILLKAAPLESLESKIISSVQNTAGAKAAMVNDIDENGVPVKTLAPLFGRIRSVRRKIETPPHARLVVKVSDVNPDDPVAMRNLKHAVAKSMQAKGVRNAVMEVKNKIVFEFLLKPGPSLEDWEKMKAQFKSVFIKTLDNEEVKDSNVELEASMSKKPSGMRVMVTIEKEVTGGLGLAEEALELPKDSPSSWSSRLGDSEALSHAVIKGVAVSSSRARISTQYVNMSDLEETVDIIVTAPTTIKQAAGYADTKSLTASAPDISKTVSDAGFEPRVSVTSFPAPVSPTIDCTGQRRVVVYTSCMPNKQRELLKDRAGVNDIEIQGISLVGQSVEPEHGKIKETRENTPTHQLTELTGNAEEGIWIGCLPYDAPGTKPGAQYGFALRGRHHHLNDVGFGPGDPQKEKTRNVSPLYGEIDLEGKPCVKKLGGQYTRIMGDEDNIEFVWGTCYRDCDEAWLASQGLGFENMDTVGLGSSEFESTGSRSHSVHGFSAATITDWKASQLSHSRLFPGHFDRQEAPTEKYNINVQDNSAGLGASSFKEATVVQYVTQVIQTSEPISLVRARLANELKQRIGDQFSGVVLEEGVGQCNIGLERLPKAASLGGIERALLPKHNVAGQWGTSRPDWLRASQDSVSPADLGYSGPHMYERVQARLGMSAFSITDVLLSFKVRRNDDLNFDFKIRGTLSFAPSDGNGGFLQPLTSLGLKKAWIDCDLDGSVGDDVGGLQLNKFKLGGGILWER